MQEAKYKYAGYWPRMWAYNTDLLILLIPYYVLSLLITDDRLLYLSCFIATLLYHAVFESSSRQATPGKMALKIKVVNESGDRVSFHLALLRFLLKIVSLLALYIGFIMIGFSKKGQALHDRWLHTLVIFDEGSN